MNQVVEQAETRNRPARPARPVKSFFIFLVGIGMIAVAWQMTRVKQSEQRRLHQQREAFFQDNGIPALSREMERNREALQRARRRLSATFTRYKSGVPEFAESLTTWGARYRITKAVLADWWSDSNEARKVATDEFNTHVVSDEQLRTGVANIINQFASDVEANRNLMLSEVEAKATTAGLALASPAFDSTNLVQGFMSEVQPLITAQAVDSPAVAILGTGGGFIATEAATRIISQLFTSLATRIATGAAARGSAVAAGALTGGGGGTALAPGVGTAIGIAGGIVVGCAVDLWMQKRFKEKVTDECNAILTDMETVLWSDPQHGLEAEFTKVISTGDQCHQAALRKIIMGE